MIELGKYAATVLWAYGISLLLLAGIIGQTIRANARARAALQEHENRG
ncbi:heme exporter protein CcmD [Paracoccus shanxieyensis]|uniref:Heme exporter protein D n=1 Tax=Paracoccus shanxieyensis TaxID=2675752 RepID=A0A6L6IYS4_9RHOB|nr:heme exporter protein CcmD [Paracoccus shanxieyensis]MTH64771.1 heme exporter protein CcmD [Paracoccus shanxieyensis]MTH87996.1 heme exporter protein CcmD [Paracoccus shanxieyensis]